MEGEEKNGVKPRLRHLTMLLFSAQRIFSLLILILLKVLDILYLVTSVPKLPVRSTKLLSLYLSISAFGE